MRPENFTNFISFENIIDWPKEFLESNLYSKLEFITFIPYDCDHFDISEFKNKDFNIFDRILSEEEITRLRINPNCFFIYDLIAEGFSQKPFNIFEMLYNSAVLSNIPPWKIFYFTSNIIEEQDNRINVISFNYFERHQRHTFLTIDETVKTLKECKFENFLCLNRVKRPMRLLSIYQIFNSKLKNNTLMSYDKISYDEMIDTAKEFNTNLDEFKIRDLIETSPSILDRTDFDINWAICDYPVELYYRTLISLVNETLHHTGVIFYSEKTFNPMIVNHPVIIIGQQNSNQSLSKIGFKPYDSYFDLSFDHIEDYYERLKQQIVILEKLNDNLNSMTIEQKIDWLLQDKETLEYNKQALRECSYSNNAIKKFINRITELTY